jgi:photosystem II stability/assembly factor-like uncharacterized protein
MKKLIIIVSISLYINPVYNQWIQQTSGTTNNLTAIYFINENTGFCVGSGNTIIKTINSGNNWIQVISPVQVNFDYVKMFSQDNVIIGSLESNLIIKTTNGGLSFETIVVNIPSYENKLKIQFVSFQNGFFLTGSSIYKTTNGGTNWSSVYTSVGNRDIAFIDENNGFLCCRYTFPYPPPYGTNYSEIRKTANSGLNWEVLVSIQELSFGIYRVFFVNSNTGFYNGFFTPSLARTVNGGYSWNAGSYGAGNYKNYYNFSFSNTVTGWFIGDQIIKTTNAGLNWNVMSTPFGSSFKGIHFIDTLNGWMVSGGGLIIKTSTGGLSGINNITAGIPSEFSLSQNYPNPFNPSTKIKFAIPLSKRVSEGRGVYTKLLVYDILGMEVAVLVNEQLRPGTYEVDWDASAFPSGVYFYSINSGSFKETKKMVLLK